MNDDRIPDDELDRLIASAETARDDLAAARIFVEIVYRIGHGQRLTGKAAHALVRGLASIFDVRAAGAFLFPGELYKRRPGRPSGSKTKYSETQARNRLNAVFGLNPEGASPLTERQVRRIRAEITGERRKPGRPKKLST